MIQTEVMVFQVCQGNYPLSNLSVNLPAHSKIPSLHCQKETNLTDKTKRKDSVDLDFPNDLSLPPI